MRLKYYLRGAGIGITVTTILFMILISMHKNDGAQGSGVPLQSQDTESKTVTQMIKDTDAQESVSETENGVQAPDAKAGDMKGAPDAKAGEKADASGTKEKDGVSDTKAKAQGSASGAKAGDKPDASGTKAEDKPAASETQTGDKPDASGTKPGEQKPEQKPEEENTPQKPEQTQEKVRIEISGGQYSDVVCKKLHEAGLVDSAKDFNDYLIKKGYDDGILPGVYEIPKGATYEEIAVLLTTKVR